MKNFIFLYKENMSDITYKYVDIVAKDIKEATDLFTKKYPRVFFAACYDRAVLPFLKAE